MSPRAQLVLYALLSTIRHFEMSEYNKEVSLQVELCHAVKSGDIGVNKLVTRLRYSECEEYRYRLSRRLCKYRR